MPGDPASAAGGRSIIEARFFDDKKYDIGRVGRYKLNKKLNLNIAETQRTLTIQDLVAAVEYLINLTYDEGSCDDIDHLGNRRIRSVGELLQNQFRVGLSRIERIVKERMTLQNSDTLPRKWKIIRKKWRVCPKRNGGHPIFSNSVLQVHGAVCILPE